MKNIFATSFFLVFCGQVFAQTDVGNGENTNQQINQQVNINQQYNPQVQVAINNSDNNQAQLGYNEPVAEQQISNPVQVRGNVNPGSVNVSSGYSGSSGSASGTVRHHSHKSHHQSAFMKKLLDKKYKFTKHYGKKSRVRRCHKF